MSKPFRMPELIPKIDELVTKSKMAIQAALTKSDSIPETLVEESEGA